MTAPLQPANRKLLDDATAAATYRTAAQVDTQADARINAMLTAQKAQPSGLATLGSDGLVPSTQLPPANSVARGVLAAVTAAAGTVLASAAGEATPVRLTATLDPTRNYELEAVGLYATGSSGIVSIRALAGSTAPTTSTGTQLTQLTSQAASSYVPAQRARFTVGTAGPYTVAVFTTGGGLQAGSAAGTMPATVTVTDVGPKVSGLPAVP